MVCSMTSITNRPVNVILALILRMATDLEIFQELTRPTLNEFEKFMSFNASVIYAILHEPIYLQGYRRA